MTTLKSEFIDLAEELIGEEFADFGVSSTVVKSTGWNDLAQSDSTVSSDSFYLIPMESKKSQFDQQNIQLGDLVAIGQRQKITRLSSLFDFGLDNSHVVYGGVDHTIVDTYLDPAEASIQFHLRPK